MDHLRKRHEFRRAAKGVRAESACFVLQACAAPERAPAGPARIGFTVTKKVGKAVERNRIRRRLRAAVSLAEGDFRPAHDYVVVARRPAIARPFATMVTDIRLALPIVHGRLDRRRGQRGAEIAPAEDASRAAGGSSPRAAPRVGMKPR